MGAAVWRWFEWNDCGTELPRKGDYRGMRLLRYCLPISCSMRVIRYNRGTIESISMYSSRA